MNINITNELQYLPFDTDLAQMIKHTPEYNSFYTDADFINETLDVLESNNLSHKKSFFIDNQVYITDTVNNLHKLMNIFDENSIDSSNKDYSLIRLYQIVGITLKRLEKGIENFNKELTGQVSSKNVKEDIRITEDTIKDAMKNNENTIQIVNDLKNPEKTEIDERTIKIQEDFKELARQKSIAQQAKKFMAQQTSMIIPAGYLIASQDLSEFKIIDGNNFSKEALNKMIERSGIDNARVFQLSEMTTKQKIIQKTVTVVE